MPKIAKNFSLSEFTRSSTAESHGIDNTPSDAEFIQLVYLADVMQSFRDILGKPITITSGYRCLPLNRVIGSKDTSKHTKGRACDFVVQGMTAREVFNALKESGTNYSKLILEFPGTDREWNHLEINEFAQESSKKHLLAEKINGFTRYSEIA